MALACAGIFRRELPAWGREHWPAVVLGLSGMAAAASLLRGALSSSEARKTGVLAALFALALAVLYLQPQRVASDGIFYFAPLRSLVIDGDLDFHNEYRVLGAPEGFHVPTATGRLPNPFSIGPALWWAPFYAIAHLAALLGAFRPTGFGYPYFTAVATGTALAGFLGVFWTYRLIRSYFDSPIALAAAVALWLGTFHVWYMVAEPSMSHAPAMAAVAGYLLACRRLTRSGRSAALLGAAAGVVVLMRWQNLLFLPAGLLLRWEDRGRPAAAELLWTSGALLLVFAPQMIYWKLLYGSFLLVPQGERFIDWSSPEWIATLFSSRAGLLSWSPVLWLGAIGMAGFFQKRPAFAGGLVAGFLAALTVNASVQDWWAGASFGARRFDGALPAFGLGMAAALEWAVPRIRRHALGASFVLLVPLIVWNGVLAKLYFSGALPQDGPVSFRQAAADGIDLLYGIGGYPFSWPGALLESYRQDLPLAAYDLAGAQYRFHNVEIRMGETDALYLGPGWSLPRREREATFREPGPHGGVLFVALREPAPYALLIEARSDHPLEVEWNGAALARIEPAELPAAVVEVPAERVREGLNRLCLRSPSAGRVRVARVALTRRGSLD